ncbi:MAG: polyphosphate kinase 1 [Dehalococcoidia bacterium]|nr:polyphosphate kinase 1 [Dehalococcoidia bacterium]
MQTEATAPKPPPAVFDLDDPQLYLNRELSLLEFNRRVLAEAQDPRNPLLERVKFLAITASNMDEFYAKRIGFLSRVEKSDPRTTTVDGLTIGEQMVHVQRLCDEIRREMDRCWVSQLRPALAGKGIRISSFNDLDESARERLSRYFEQSIFPVLTPLVVDPSHPFPFISSGSLSIALVVRHPRTGQERFARIKVPQNRQRFIDAGEGHYLLLEDLIAAHLEMLFPGMDIVSWHTLRVIRSAEIGSPGEDASDLLELIENELRRRRLNEAVYFAFSARIPAAYLELMLEELDLTEDATYATDAPLGLADLFQIGLLPLAELADPPFIPAVPSAFSAITDASSLFATIRERDLLVHHPYESFDSTVVRFIDEAADDPQVLAIKQTLYRTAPDSPILDSLIDAVGRGKQVAVLVELTARFDEANNIEWARKLEDAGVHVAYGNPDEKIHSKICLVVREETNGITLYAHVGTGNYNSATARIYTDFGLFTADPGITNDLLRVFNHLTGYSDHIETSDLLVAPESLRSGIESRIHREIEHARAGRPARVVFKMNALEDFEMTRLLYKASQAGVTVDLLVRGVCRIRPGIPGLSENVRVISVIGRFLEHSRIYRFENAGDPEYYIGSADLMKRNLDGRIEVVTPVRRPELRAHIDDVLETMLADTRQGWQLHDSAWTRDPSVDTPGTHATLLAAAPFS